MTLETFFLLSGTLSLVAVIPLACLIAVVCMLRAERRRADTMARDVRKAASDVRRYADKSQESGQELPNSMYVNGQRNLAAALYRIADGEDTL